MANELFDILSTFADEVSSKLSLVGAAGEPEEQLRAPFEKFIQSTGHILGMDVVPMGEVRVKDIGKPDYAIYCNGSLCGYVEIKRIGKGAVHRFIKDTTSLNGNALKLFHVYFTQMVMNGGFFKKEKEPLPLFA